MRNSREPYKQFMFHFQGRNSIDGRNVNDEELSFLREMIKPILTDYSSNRTYNQKIAIKLLVEYIPHELL